MPLVLCFALLAMGEDDSCICQELTLFYFNYIMLPTEVEVETPHRAAWTWWPF